MPSHEVLGGLVQVYKRPRSRYWWCRASVAHAQHRTSTEEEGLAGAKQFAEDWFLGLRGQARTGLLKKPEKTFREAADVFTAEYGTITEGQRSPKWVQGHQIRLRLHLNPFFGDLGVSEVNAGTAQDYRVYRMTGKRPGRRTCWRTLVSDPTRRCRITFSDVTIVEDHATGERILEIDVRGKRGVGYCKSMPRAVKYYERLLGRAKPVTKGEREEAKKNGTELKPKYPEPTDPVFPGNHIKLFNGILLRTKLKLDREGNKRTAYSLRHTYICMRLMEGADIYQIASVPLGRN
jgi:hypothetical protein